MSQSALLERKRPRSEGEGAASDEIGVVVIGRNEGERLVKCLKSVHAAGRCVVYVDSGSVDGSPQTAQRLGAHIVLLDASRPFSAARARNEGVAALRQLRPDIAFVQFIDGDCELDRSWIAQAAKFLAQHDDVAVVCGRRREQYPSRSMYNFFCDIEWEKSVGMVLRCGGDALVRVTAFEAVGGFRAQMIAGEEGEFCLRLREKGWKIWQLDAEMTRHDAAMKTFGQWWLRCVRSGYGLADLTSLHWRSPYSIWTRAFLRSVVIGAALPMLIIAGAFIHPAAFALLLAYVLQVCRIAVRRGAFSRMSWAYAAFVTLAKFANLLGIVTFYWHKLNREPISLIEYK